MMTNYNTSDLLEVLATYEKYLYWSYDLKKVTIQGSQVFKSHLIGTIHKDYQILFYTILSCTLII